MAEQVFKLSATGRAMLRMASTREDRLVRPPQLPIAAARQVARSLLNHGLVEEVPAPSDDAADAWREAGGGAVLVLRATNQGLMAIGGAADPVPEPSASEPADLTSSIEAFTQVVSDQGQQTVTNEDQTQRTEGHAADDSVQPKTATEAIPASHAVARDAGDEAARDEETRPEASQPPTRASLRQAALTLLEAWSNAASRALALGQPIAALRLARGQHAPQTTSEEPRMLRENTKQTQGLTMLRPLRRPEGATVAQIAQAMGWTPHTVRGFFAGLKTRHGIVVEAAERVRQVGPNQQGAKGSYTVYRIAGAG